MPFANKLISILFVLISGQIWSLEIPEQFQFIQFHQDLNQNTDIYKLQESSNEELASELLKNNELLEFYDEAFIETQIECGMYDGEAETVEQKCFQVLDKFETINLIMYPENSEYTPENMLGIDLTAEKVLEDVIESDPNYKLLEEANSTPGRNSVLLKGGGQILSEELKINELRPCDIKVNNQMIALPLKELSEANLDLLKNLLTDERTPLANKQQTYCALEDYFETNEMFDELHFFLYLNMPDGEHFCP